MALITKGRVARKAQGRDAGEACVVLTDPKDNKVLVEGPKVRRRQVNVLHLEPTNKIVEAGEDADSQKIKELLAESE